MATGKDQTQQRLLYAFGEFTLDLARGALSNADGDIYLRPKSFSVLCYLVQHHGVLVSREDLLEAVWHNAQVGDDSIAQCIVEIRRVIGDDGRTMIRTVPRRGFVFEPAVIESAFEADKPANGDWIRNWRPLFVATGVAAIVAIALAFWIDSRNMTDQGPDTEVRDPLPSSIAVLAFDDMSESQDQQYFGEGIAEEILTQLSRIPGLNVIARTSSFSMRRDQLDIASIAERLGVLYVLEGSVRKSGKRMRVTAQLIETQSSTRVWSKNYDLEETADNFIDLQHDVAQSVAAAIGAGTFSPETGLRRLPHTKSTEALDQHLKGLYFLRKVETSPNSPYEKALHHFDLAIAADPKWAPPYAASGRVLHFRASRQLRSENTSDYEGARKRLLKAIELDPAYAPAYEALAFVTHTHDIDFTKSEMLYKKAFALGGERRWGYAILLGSTGRIDEAIKQYQYGLFRDPLALAIKAQLARMLICAQRYEESIVQYRELLAATSQEAAINAVIADLYLQVGETNKAQELLTRYPDFERNLKRAGPIYAKLGMTAKAEAALKAIESDEEWMAESAVRTALLLGQKDRALDYLIRAANADPTSLMLIQCHPDVVSLADEPRYQQALDIVGFPPEHRRGAIKNHEVALAR